MIKPRNANEIKPRRKRQATREFWDNKRDINITTKVIPEHHIFYGLPRKEEGRFIRTKYVKPLVQHLKVPRSEINPEEGLIRNFESKLKNTCDMFEETLDEGLAEVEDLFLDCLGDMKDTILAEWRAEKKRNRSNRRKGSLKF